MKHRPLGGLGQIRVHSFDIELAFHVDDPLIERLGVPVVSFALCEIFPGHVMRIYLCDLILGDWIRRVNHHPGHDLGAWWGSQRALVHVELVGVEFPEKGHQRDG